MLLAAVVFMTVKLYQAVGVITLLSLQCLGDRAVWLGWTAVRSMSFSLHHCFKCVWSAANDRVRLVNEFVQSVYATGCDAATPNRLSKVKCTGNNRLISNILVHMLKNLSFLRKWSLLISPLYISSGMGSTSRECVLLLV